MQLKVTHTDRSGEELFDHIIAFRRTNASAVDGKQMPSASLDHEMTDSNATIVNLNVKDVTMRSLVKKDSAMVQRESPEVTAAWRTSHYVLLK